MTIKIVINQTGSTVEGPEMACTSTNLPRRASHIGSAMPGTWAGERAEGPHRKTSVRPSAADNLRPVDAVRVVEIATFFISSLRCVAFERSLAKSKERNISPSSAARLSRYS